MKVVFISREILNNERDHNAWELFSPTAHLSIWKTKPFERYMGWCFLITGYIVI